MLQGAAILLNAARFPSVQTNVSSALLAPACGLLLECGMGHGVA